MSSLYFTNRKYADAFIKFMLDYNQDLDNNDYFEIHIYQEETGIIVEFDKVPYSGEWGGRFKYIDEDEEVGINLCLPDNSYVFVRKYEAEDYLNDWLKDNPEYRKDR